jgi:AsmA family protein
MRPPFLRQPLRLIGIAALIISLPAIALASVYADTFASLRQNIAGRILTDALDMPFEVRGPVTASFEWVPRFSITDVVASETELPADLKGASIESIEVNLPLLPLIIGQARPNSLTIDGLRIEISIPKDDASPDDDMDVAKVVGEFVRARVANDLLLRDATIDYVNQENGFVLRSAVHSLASKPAADGGVAVTGGGHLNGNPWTLDGRVAPPDEASEQRNFAFSMAHWVER